MSWLWRTASVAVLVFLGTAHTSGAQNPAASSATDMFAFVGACKQTVETMNFSEGWRLVESVDPAKLRGRPQAAPPPPAPPAPARTPEFVEVGNGRYVPADRPAPPPGADRRPRINLLELAETSCEDLGVHALAAGWFEPRLTDPDRLLDSWTIEPIMGLMASGMDVAMLPAMAQLLVKSMIECGSNGELTDAACRERAACRHYEACDWHTPSAYNLALRGDAGRPDLPPPTGGGKENEVPVHGNWCGPGHGGGPPTSRLDAACREHDQCYERRGYFDCGCDLELLKAAERLTGDAGEVAAALAIIHWYETAPCSFVPADASWPARVGGVILAPVTGFLKHLFR